MHAKKTRHRQRQSDTGVHGNKPSCLASVVYVARLGHVTEETTGGLTKPAQQIRQACHPNIWRP